MRILRSLLTNLASIMLSLVLAIIIWASAVRDANPIGEKEFTIAVQVLERADAILISEPQSTVLVGVTAPASTLEELRPSNCRAYIDLEGVGFLEEAVDIQVECDESFAFAPEAIDVFPSTTTVQMDQLVSVEVPVVLVEQDNVPATHELQSVVPDPATVTISGPALEIGLLNEARATVFLDNVRTTRTIQRPLIFYDSQGSVRNLNSSNIQKSTESTSVTIDVTQRDDRKSVSIQPNWTGLPATGYRFLSAVVEPSTVLISGQPDDLASYTSIRTEAIDITGLTEQETLKVALLLPEDVELIDSETVFMTVSVEERMTTEIFSAEPNVSGLGDTLTATLDVETVNVVLFGPQLALESINQSDFRVDLDLFGLTTGTHEVAPSVSVAIESVEIRERQPAVVTVVISPTMTETVTATIKTVTETEGTSGNALTITVANANSTLVSVPMPPAAIAPIVASTKLRFAF
ncbi:MAG: CdaR family protein [Candidatus Promineifilaceae bacterium]